jgi:tetratricopeptide (TPR) repeat protein
MNASYGYAYSVFNALKDSTDLLKPTFALQKLTEQKINDAVSLNLLGLFLERLGQYNRAAEVFASTILALEAQVEDDKITQEEGALRLSKVHTNLSRALCASGDFCGAIASFESSQQTSVYSQLNAGIAYYFTEQLEASLSMFEMALDTTQDDITLRQDVIVLLSKVLWALGGDEQRAVAKDQLFSR